MTKESAKTKTTTNKSILVPPNMEFDAFLKNQQNIISRLKTDLKSLISKTQLSECGATEKDKYILELEHSINQRDTEVHKLSANLDQLKKENSQILLEFNLFKEKFYQLEIDYDRILTEQKQENQNLMDQLQKQQSFENQEIEKLSLKCNDLQQRLQNSIQDLNHLNTVHEETLRNFELMETNFAQQQTKFDLYKKQVNEERRLNDEKNKLDLENLKEEIRRKDETINQCITDKNNLEKEKNVIIDELNHKIQRIERAFNQPTKVVQPMVPLHQQNNNLDNSNSESSNDNVAITKPQVRKPLENLSVQNFSNIENQKAEQNQTQRSFKFKRPIQPATSSQQLNVDTNNGNKRKRRNQPLRQTTAIKNYNELSLSSSDEDDDNDSNYNSFSHQLWRPNNECYVPDTDTSEGFVISKRSKK